MMEVMSPVQTLEQKMLQRISAKRRNVFLRADFADLAGYSQVGRALRALVRNGVLLKLGHGIYVRAQISPFTGSPAPTIGIKRIVEEAMSRLNIPVAPSSFEVAYNEGETTQVPTGRVIGVRKRVRRRLGFGNVKVVLERVPN